MLHDEALRNHRRPQYSKKVTPGLGVSFSVLRILKASTECLITFHNTLGSEISLSAPKPSHDTTAQNGDETTQTMLNETSLAPTALLLGYVQVAGYVVLNYEFDADAASNPMDAFSKHASWWHNKTYSHQYSDSENPDDNGDPHEQVSRTPFVRQSRMVIGGRVAGINDLAADGSHTVNSKNRHLLQDLICTFNSFPPPARGQNDENFIPGSELADAIVPFYTTPQSILFTDISIAPGQSKTFHVLFPSPSGPPSYNTRLSGPACDQGWISIRYTLVVGFQTGPTQGEHKAVYFPLDIKFSPDMGDERWHQPNFLTRTIIDKQWKIELQDVKAPKERETTPEPSCESREVFLEDLHRLIDSDLYNMPRMSTSERKKSVHEVHAADRSVVAQIPSHLKTRYQIRVNSRPLCTVHFSKPYYLVGDTLGFVVELQSITSTRIAGYVAHIEAHEVFHVADAGKDANGNETGNGTGNGSKNDSNDSTTTAQSDGNTFKALPAVATSKFTNVYRVSPAVKANTLAAAFDDDTQVCGQIYIPTHLCQQFQSSSLMDLKYFVVLKFVIFETEDQDSESFQDVEHYKQDNEGDSTTFRLPLVLVGAR